MKELSDGTKVPVRTWYYLLDWNEFDDKNFMVSQFGKQRLADLNRVEFKRLLNKATTSDLSQL